MRSSDQRLDADGVENLLQPAIATVWYSVSSYRLMTCLLTPSLRASSV